MFIMFRIIFFIWLGIINLINKLVWLCTLYKTKNELYNSDIATMPKTLSKVINFGHELSIKFNDRRYKEFNLIDGDVFTEVYNYLENNNYIVESQWLDILVKCGDKSLKNSTSICTEPLKIHFKQNILILFCYLYYNHEQYNGSKLYRLAAIYGSKEITESFLNDLMTNNAIKIYEFDEYSQRWDYMEKYKMNCGELSGKQINSIYDTIIQDIQNYKKYKANYSFLGKMQGLNYLLIGPPGNGKTSVIKNLVKHHNTRLYKTSLSAITKVASLNQVLSVENTYDDDVIFIVLEDFDRYIEKIENGDSKFDYSIFLNCLDGIEKNNHIVRIFTANDPGKITDKALLSRFKRIFHLTYPDVETITEHINKYYTKFPNYIVTDHEIKIFSSLAVKKYGLNMRSLNNLLTRIVDVEEPMKEAIKILPEYVEESRICTKDVDNNILCH